MRRVFIFGLLEMLDVKKEAATFSRLSHDEKLERVQKWLGELAYHYDYFRDLDAYVYTHKASLDDTFLEAMFQIILNLAKEVEKL